MWSYFGYDCRFSYGSYRKNRHWHVKELLVKFNRCLRAAKELERQGKLKILKVYRSTDPWDVDKRYFIYEDDNSSNNHWYFMNHGGCSLARGIYTPEDWWALPNQIDDRSDEAEYAKHEEYQQRYEDRLPIKLSERMADQFRFLEEEVKYMEWEDDYENGE